MSSSMSFFLFALTAVLAATANAFRPVLDIDGDPISGKRSYYVLSAIPHNGGLTLRGEDMMNLCNSSVIHGDPELDQVIPVKFANWKPKTAIVPVSTELNIKMVLKPTDLVAETCGVSEYWWVDSKNFVQGGGKRDQWLNSPFRIQEVAGGAYKFVFCKSGLCKDIGIFVDPKQKNVRRLAISAKPFLVKFKKVK